MTQAQGNVVPLAPRGKGGLGGKGICDTFPSQSKNQNQNQNREQKAVRQRNEVWDSLVEILGFEPLTATEKSLWGKVVYSLKGAGATREKLNLVAAQYHKEWPGITLTITSIEKWYGQFLSVAESGRRRKAAVCGECGCGGGQHVEGCSKVGGTNARQNTEGYMGRSRRAG